MLQILLYDCSITICNTPYILYLNYDSMNQKVQQKFTIAQRMNFLEQQTNNVVTHMSGSQYFFRTGTKSANIKQLNIIFKQVELEIKNIVVNDSGTLTLMLGEV